MRKLIFSACMGILCLCATVNGQRSMENLGRGVVAVRSSSGAFISWRLLALDPSGIGFNIYRSVAGATATKLNSSVLTAGTNYSDATADLTKSNAYYVKPVISGVEQAASAPYTLPANSTAEPCFVVPLKTPKTGYYTKYVWVGDLDGDGEYDFVIDRLAPNDTNLTNTGTGSQSIEAYKRDGTFLWSVDLGANSLNLYGIAPGSSAISVGNFDGVTVYDMDCDGIAEVLVRTANGVTFGDGTKLTASSDLYQYISVLNGKTGAERARIQIPTDYIARGQMGAIMGIAYLNGTTPSLVAKMKNRNADLSFNEMICAWDFNGTSITQKWKWLRGSTESAYPDGHQIRIADVNADGKDEVCEIGFCLNGDGTARYSLAGSNIVHGDRFYVAKMDPSSSVLQGYGIQQNNASGILEYYYNASTGAMIWQHTTTPPAGDVGRGIIGDIDPRYAGYEIYSFYGVYNAKTNTQITTSASPYPSQTIWWNGDLLNDNLSTGKVEQWDYTNSTTVRLLTNYKYEGAINSTDNPLFMGDILGDWRTEIIYPNGDFSKLVVFTTDIATTNRIYTLAQNPQYRVQMALKGYMESPFPDYYLGDGMSTPSTPNISYVNIVKLKNVATSLYIDGLGNTASGSNCGQYANGSGNNQRWVIEAYGGYVKFKNYATGLYLDGLGRTSNGSACGQYPLSSGNNQRWVQETSGSYYKFKNVATSLYLDGLGLTTNGSILGQFSSSSGTNQQWVMSTIKSVEVSEDEPISVSIAHLSFDIYPNPAQTDNVTFSFVLNNRSSVKVGIKDIMGKTILEKELGVFGAGKSELPFNLSLINKGIYIVYIKTAEGLFSQKLIKL